MSKRKSIAKKNQVKKSFWFRKFIMTFLLLIFLAGVGFVILCYQYLESELPDVSNLKGTKLPVPMKVFTKDGKLLAEFGEIRSTPIPYEQIPPRLVQAVISTEDQNFFEHSGVDFAGLTRAAVELVLTGSKSQGGSTVTMQVARNFYLSREKTFARKFNEILLARKIDAELSKKEIMALYLNKIYLGNRAYGVSAAAQVYYGVPLNQLSLAQLATIAGLPKAPSTINPIANPVAAKKRRNHVLARMFELGYINKTEYDEALKAPITATYHGPKVEISAPYIAEMVRNSMVSLYGNEAYTKGFKVYTTIDSKDQLAANLALRRALLSYDKRHGYRGVVANLGKPEKSSLLEWREKLRAYPTMSGVKAAAVISVQAKSAMALLENGDIITLPAASVSWASREGARDLTQFLKSGDVIRVVAAATGKGWEFSQVPKVQGAIVSINPNDGAIIALVGGFGYSSGDFNRAVQGARQPGSSFKPFIYSAALERGFTLASIFNDAPIVIHDPSMDHPWRPQNDKGEYSGPMRLREALVRSRNLVSIRVLAATGLSYAIDYAGRFGFDLKKLPYGLSLALGTANLTPLELATGYAVFANGGYRVTPYLIDHIANDQGEIIFQANPKTACTTCVNEPVSMQSVNGYAPHVISSQNAFMMTTALQDVVRRGTGRGALVLNRNDLGGKTGTTNDKMDAWFAGFTGDIATVAWVGFDQPKSLNEYGAQAALPLWIGFMDQALQTRPPRDLIQPPGVTAVLIDPRTGLKAYKNQSNAVIEYFVDSKIPKAEASPYFASQESSDEGAAMDSDDAPVSDGSNENEDDGHLF